ncbi:hypothetical protein G3M48_009557 [Beauveria asiatica]|uniref:Secreted protein n=1 Tax=Beauveria asiatica TaxID=1069075 RepID=A0AAW0S275_9HYPO
MNHGNFACRQVLEFSFAMFCFTLSNTTITFMRSSLLHLRYSFDHRLKAWPVHVVQPPCQTLQHTYYLVHTLCVLCGANRHLPPQHRPVAIHGREDEVPEMAVDEDARQENGQLRDTKSTFFVACTCSELVALLKPGRSRAVEDTIVGR